MGIGFLGDSGGSGTGFLGGGGGGPAVGASAGGGKKKQGRHGVLGFAENLGTGAYKTLEGLGAGIPALADAVAHEIATEARQGGALGYLSGQHKKSPLLEKIVKPAVKAEAHYYAPLAHGQFGKFGHRFYDDPTQPLLDLLAVATGGAGLAAKTGEALSAAGKISETSRLARLGRAGEVTLRSPGAQAGEAGAAARTRLVGRGSPLVRVRKTAVHKGLMKLPSGTPGLGETSRFARAERAAAYKRRLAEALSRESADYTRAVKGFTPQQHAAVNLIARAIHPAAYAAVLKRAARGGETVRGETLTLLRDPEVHRLYENPTPEVAHAVEAARALSKRSEQLGLQHGFLAAKTAEESPYRHLTDIRLTKPPVMEEPPGLTRLRKQVAGFEKRHQRAQAAVRTKTGELKFTSADTKRIGQIHQPDDSAVGAAEPRSIVMEGPSPYVTLARGGIAYPTGTANAGRLGSALSVARDRLQAAEKAAATRQGMSHAEYQRAVSTQAERQAAYEQSIAELKKPLQGTAREPFHLRDVGVADERVPKNLPAGRGQGVVSPTHRSRLVLFHMGQLQLGKETLNSSFLRRVNDAHADDIHETLLRSARRIAKGAPLPEGYAYVRRRIGKGSEQIPYTERTLGDFERSFDSFATKHGGDGADLAELGGDRLIAPEKFIRELTGEFTRSSSVLRKFLAPPFAVWRALVLGFRPAFLVNNVVGNHLLYAIKHGGYNGLRGYLDAVKREHGESAVMGLIRDKAVPPALYDRLMRDYFPEQVGGTFGATQRVGGKVGETARKVGGGIIPATQAVAENQLRRATVMKLLRTSPEVRRVLDDMPKQTRDLETAARQALDANPELVREISEKVDDTLGSYLNMSKFEREAVRTLAPFYPWYRAILRITRTLVLDQPVRAAIVQKLGQVGADIANTQLGPIPAEYQGLYPQGQAKGGYQQVLAGGGLNPFSTVAQLGQAAASVVGGAPGSAARDAGGLINPYIAGAIQAYTGRNLYTGQPLKGGRLGRGMIGGTLAEVGRGLPEARIIEAALHAGRYKRGAKPGVFKRNLRTELLAAAGYPQKQANLGLLHSLAQR